MNPKIMKPVSYTHLVTRRANIHRWWSVYTVRSLSCRPPARATTCLLYTSYMVFFKAPDADAMTAAFKEYTAKQVRKAERDRHDGEYVQPFGCLLYASRCV